MSELYTCKDHTEDYDFCPICKINKLSLLTEYWRLIAENKMLNIAEKEIEHKFLVDLVKAIDGSFISSWQTTEGWQKQLDAAIEFLQAKGEVI